MDQFGGLGQQLDEPAFVERVEDINSRLLQAIDLTEDELEEKTVLHTPFQPLQRSLLMLGKGNEKVLPGREQWLFYSKDVEHLISSSDVEERPYSINNPKNDPVKAIVDFRDKLRQRGVELVLLPTPLKPMIHPEKLSPMSTALSETVYYDGWRDLKQRLEKNTVHFFDPSPVLKQFVLDRGKDAYLMADTHWTPAAMEVVAQHLAEYLHTDLGIELGSVKYKKEPEVIENQGDIADMLKLSADKGYQKESVEIYPVFTEGGNCGDNRLRQTFYCLVIPFPISIPLNRWGGDAELGWVSSSAIISACRSIQLLKMMRAPMLPGRNLPLIWPEELTGLSLHRWSSGNLLFVNLIRESGK